MNLRRNSGTNLRNKPEKILVETYKEFLKNSRRNLFEAILDRIPGGVPERDSVGILEKNLERKIHGENPKRAPGRTTEEASSKGESQKKLEISLKELLVESYKKLLKES